MTETVTVSGHDPFAWQEPADVCLHITGTPPAMVSLERANEWYEEQARIVADIIFGNLSQGVVDRVLLALMERYVSSYRGKTGSDRREP